MQMDIDVDSSPYSMNTTLEDGLVSAWQSLSPFGLQDPSSNDLFNYFKALEGVLSKLSRQGALGPVEEIMHHVDYLAGKTGFSAKSILKGERFLAKGPVVFDTLVNIGDVLRTVQQLKREQIPEGIPEDVFMLILEAEANLTGWCSREKALVIAHTVLRERPVTCVEIGIFGGRSLMPCAAALRHIGAGVIYGIEAWRADVAVENATTDANDEWWSKVDFNQVKQDFYRFVAATNLVQHVRLIEAPSARAASLFDQIDYLHIDGSHSMVNAAEDVVLYARKVRSGGIVVFDDINWKTTTPARELLGTLCTTVTVLKDPETGLDICEVMRRR
jgi:predicted O-methyltransferase YrrM